MSLKFNASTFFIILILSILHPLELFGERKSQICEEKNIISLEKGIEEIIFNGNETAVFKVGSFVAPFYVTVSQDKLRYYSLHGTGKWISLKECGESCITWGIIDRYTTCVIVEGGQIGVFDQGSYPEKRSFTSMFKDGVARITNISLRVITKDNAGYIKINNSNPIKIWEKKIYDEFKIQKNSNCPPGCTVLKKWACSKDGNNCIEIIENMDLNKIGECYSTVSPFSGKFYKVCDKGGVIKVKDTSTGNEKEIHNSFLYIKKEFLCEK